MTNTASLILMGGQNKRMQGKHKAFLSLEDTTFLHHIISALKDFPKIYLSVENQSKYPELTYPLIEDEYKGIGPLGGIYSALKQIPETYLFVTACDMPFISTEFIHYMISQIRPDTTAIAVTSADGHFYPLGGIYSKALLPIIEEMIEEENYRLGSLLKRAHATLIPLDQTPFDETILSNINTPEEYQNCLKHIPNN